MRDADNRPSLSPWWWSWPCSCPALTSVPGYGSAALRWPREGWPGNVKKQENWDTRVSLHGNRVPDETKESIQRLSVHSPKRIVCTNLTVKNNDSEWTNKSWLPDHQRSKYCEDPNPTPAPLTLPLSVSESPLIVEVRFRSDSRRQFDALFINTPAFVGINCTQTSNNNVNRNYERSLYNIHTNTLVQLARDDLFHRIYGYVCTTDTE